MCKHYQFLTFATNCHLSMYFNPFFKDLPLPSGIWINSRGEKYVSNHFWDRKFIRTTDRPGKFESYLIWQIRTIYVSPSLLILWQAIANVAFRNIFIIQYLFHEASSFSWVTKRSTSKIGSWTSFCLLLVFDGLLHFESGPTFCPHSLFGWFSVLVRLPHPSYIGEGILHS